jgi:carboxypeptidase family protein/TonB-dependent receptor-like protein
LSSSARVIALTLVWLSSLMAPSAVHAQGRSTPAGAIEGTVSIASASLRLGGAVVTLHDARGDQIAELFADPEGRFRVDNLIDGPYRIVVSLDGFQSAETTLIVAAGRTTTVAIELPVAASERIEVTAPSTIVVNDTVAKTESIDSKESEDYTPGGGFHAALRLLASVIQVPGGMSIKGGRPNQSTMQLGAGTTLIEPSTGLVALTLPPDAVDAVEVLSNPYTVEFGRFSSGLVVLRTKRAGDAWRTRINNFDPGFRTRRGQDFKIIGLKVFAPRAEIGGPLVKDRLFLHQTAQYRWDATEIASLPQDQLRIDNWFSSFTRLDGNISTRHSFVVTGGASPSYAKHATLGTFVPPDATVTLRDRSGHAAVTARSTWTDTFFSETTVRFQRYRTNVAPRGSDAMTLLPETTLGHFFNNQTRRSATHQVVSAVSATRQGPGGVHLMKLGVDWLHSAYEGSSASRPVLVGTSNGTIVRRLDFTGGSTQRVESTDVAVFAQDRLSVGRRWYVEVGGRIDRDGILNNWNVTPRAGTAVLLDDSGNATIRGGYGLFYERTPSAAGAFEQFESWRDTRFDANGIGVATDFVHRRDSKLHTARSTTWNLAYDQRLTPSFAFHAGVLDRSGTHELIVEPGELESAASAAIRQAALLLHSNGRSRYREGEIGVDVSRGERFDVHATYVRSTAHGDLNSFTTFFGATLAPIVGANGYGPQDVPHRLLMRGRLAPTSRWLLVGLADWHSGFPYSRVDEMLDFVGPRHADRFPAAVRVELGVERRIKIGKWEPWVIVHAFNPFRTFLPTDVQANTASPFFGNFYNSEVRHFRLQFRFGR